MWHYNVIFPFLWNDSTKKLLAHYTEHIMEGWALAGYSNLVSLVCYSFALVQVLLLCSMPPCCCSYATFLTDVMTSWCQCVKMEGGTVWLAKLDCMAALVSTPSFLQKGLKWYGQNRQSVEMVRPFWLNGSGMKWLRYIVTYRTCMVTTAHPRHKPKSIGGLGASHTTLKMTATATVAPRFVSHTSRFVPSPLA